MVEDIKKKEEKKKEEKKKEEKKVSWFAKVPAVYKIGAVVLMFIQYQRISAIEGNLQELWMWGIGILIALYFLGTEGRKRESTILSPQEAEEALKMEIVRKVKEGQISKWAKIYIGPNNGLFFYEGIPRYYSIGVEIITDFRREYKKGIVFAEGNIQGYATLQDSKGKLRGDELIPVVTPKIFKTIKKYGLDIDKFIFGEPK